MLARSQSLPENIRFQHGAASNTVLIGDTTAVYGATSAKVTRVLLTHARRDAISAGNVPVIVPAAEKDLFAAPGAFWEKLETARFHDYAQQTTKVPVAPLRVERTVSDGDTLDAGGVRIRVLGDTRLYARSRFLRARNRRQADCVHG